MEDFNFESIIGKDSEGNVHAMAELPVYTIDYELTDKQGKKNTYTFNAVAPSVKEAGIIAAAVLANDEDAVIIRIGRTSEAFVSSFHGQMMLQAAEEFIKTKEAE